MSCIFFYQTNLSDLLFFFFFIKTVAYSSQLTKCHLLSTEVAPGSKAEKAEAKFNTKLEETKVNSFCFSFCLHPVKKKKKKRSKLLLKPNNPKFLHCDDQVPYP